MDTEKLKQLGLTTQQIEEIQKLQETRQFEHKTLAIQMEDLKKENQQLQDKIKIEQSTIKELKNNSIDVEKYKEQIKQAEAEKTELEKNYKKELEKTRKQNALRELLNTQVVDIEVATSLFDIDALEFDAEKSQLKNHEQRLKELQETKPYLFKKEAETKEIKEKTGINIVGVDLTAPKTTDTKTDAKAFVTKLFGNNDQKAKQQLSQQEIINKYK